MFVSLLDYIASHSLTFWVALAVVLCILEVLLGFPIAFFIAGISAVIAALSVLLYPQLETYPLIQICIFLAGIPIGFLVLWRNLKKFLIKNGGGYVNIIKQTAVVIEKSIRHGEEGKVKWSGTIVKARLSDKSEREEIMVNEKVYVLEIKENLFIVDSKPE